MVYFKGASPSQQLLVTANPKLPAITPERWHVLFKLQATNPDSYFGENIMGDPVA